MAIEETLRTGSWTVGVASDESRVGHGPGAAAGADAGGRRMDAWKERRLWQVGVHILTPDWCECDVLLEFLGLGTG